MSVSASTGSIHAMILVSGIFGPDDFKDIKVKVEFESVHEGETRTVVEEVKIPKLAEVRR